MFISRMCALSTTTEGAVEEDMVILFCEEAIFLTTRRYFLNGSKRISIFTAKLGNIGVNALYSIKNLVKRKILQDPRVSLFLHH